MANRTTSSGFKQPTERPVKESLSLPDALRGIAPRVGTQWWWEPEKAHARSLQEVVSVRWNGEACWVESRTVGEIGNLTFWNELDRWVEATVLHAVPEEL